MEMHEMGSSNIFEQITLLLAQLREEHDKEICFFQSLLDKRNGISLDEKTALQEYSKIVGDARLDLSKGLSRPRLPSKNDSAASKASQVMLPYPRSTENGERPKDEDLDKLSQLAVVESVEDVVATERSTDQSKIGANVDGLPRDSDATTFSEAPSSPRRCLSPGGKSRVGRGEMSPKTRVKISSESEKDEFGAQKDISDDRLKSYQSNITATSIASSGSFKSMWIPAPSTPPHLHFELKDEWLKTLDRSGSFNQPVDSQLAEKHANEMWSAVTDKEYHEVDCSENFKNSFVRNRIKKLLVNPTHQYRVSWDLAGMLLIAYDMIAIPVHLSFQPDASVFTDLMGWVTLMFWTWDMMMSGVTGYYHDGQLIMDPVKIVKNYLKGWFWIDCLVVIPDWVMKALGSVTNAAGLARVLRIARIMRVLRLLRLLKLQRLFNTAYDMLDSEATFIIFNLLRMLFMIIFMNHIVACAWYGVGNVCKEAGMDRNWLQNAGDTPVWDHDLGWKYLTSLHWSITQFTPASMDVSATNSPERLFSIIILFWALVALSSIIGSVSAAMTALRNMSADENKQFWFLRRYLKQNRISRALSTGIVKYLEFQQVQRHSRVPAASVKLLNQLSKHLEAELQHELTMPYLGNHPLFSYMMKDQELLSTLHRICHQAVRTHHSAEGEFIFQIGDEGREMFFVKSGWFEYEMLNGEKLAMLLGRRLWAGEATLWTNWRHRGNLRATAPSESLGVNPESFRRIFKIHPRPWRLAQNYGLAFVKYLNRIGLFALTDVVFEEDAWTAVVKESDNFRLWGVMARMGSGLSEHSAGKAPSQTSFRSVIAI